MIRNKQLRAAVLDVVRDGELTMGEAARLAGVARVTVLYWCRVAGIDAVAARNARVRKRWEAAKGRLAELKLPLSSDVRVLEST